MNGTEVLRTTKGQAENVQVEEVLIEELPTFGLALMQGCVGPCPSE